MAPSLGLGGRAGTLPTKICPGVAADRFADNDLNPVPVDLLGSSSVEMTDASVATSIVALPLGTSRHGSATMLRKSAIRRSRCTWHVIGFGCVNSTLDARAP